MEKLNSSKILVFGLPGSGKTTFARQLAVNMAYFNADEIRKMFNDWDFSMEGRLRQAERMYCLANLADGPAVVDFICPYDQNRHDYDIKIWMNTIKEGRYDDTNKMFERPMNYDVRLTDGTPEEWVEKVIDKLNKTEAWNNQAPTALLIGRYQPFHIGHKTLVAESIKRTGQCCIALRDVGGIDEKNPYNFEQVKKEIESACIEFGNKIKIIELPNITDIFYGRGVGYNIEMIELSQEMQEVSATKIRAGEIGQDGKPLGKRPE